MVILQGKSVFRDICMGRLFFYAGDSRDVVRRPVENCQEELLRFDRARTEAGEQLDRLYEESRKTVGEANAVIFQIQRMLLEDDKYVTSVRQMVEQLHMNVEYAVRVTGDNTAQMLGSVKDAYIRERAQDVLDITSRIIRILTGNRNRREFPEEPFILAAEDLLPSETVQLKRDRVLGFALSRGSIHSHTAILARSMGVPALLNLGEGLVDLYDGKEAVIDGTSGVLYIEPDEETRKLMEHKKAESDRHKILLKQLKGKADVTKGGQTMKVYANAGNLADVELAAANDAGGIGLFRSELLYLERDSEPDEELLTDTYRQVLERMEGKEVIIRTFDIGADKQAAWLGLKKEENPALGLRAVRLGLTRPELFRTQLKALYRAGRYGNLAIMYPMITSVTELRRLKQLENEAKAELEREGIPFAKKVPVGIMIETPAAAILSEELAEEVDFFSVGTNDLTQYTLALDRQNEMLEQFEDPEHKAVLRLIELAAKSAHRAGIKIGICGELAADRKLTAEFLRMEIDELSVPPGMILDIRQKIREL
ncbi:MAG: phosphoenolpyruvate--protein phosphotransferase [Acetatifactor sp.]